MQSLQLALSSDAYEKGNLVVFFVDAGGCRAVIGDNFLSPEFTPPELIELRC